MPVAWAAGNTHLTTLAPFVVLGLFPPCLVMVKHRHDDGKLAARVGRFVQRRRGAK